MKQQCDCPSLEDLSACQDGELEPRRTAEIRLHAAVCPDCGATLQQFGRLSSDLQQLTHRTADADIAAIVMARIAATPDPAARRKRRRPLPRLRLLGFGPQAMGGAAALGLGVWLGVTLLAGSGAALRPAGLSAFDGEPAAALCAGLPTCGPRGR